MSRFRIPVFGVLPKSKPTSAKYQHKGDEDIAVWTREFCKRSQWKTQPFALADDLFQQCFMKFEKIFATYHHRPIGERIATYKVACQNLVVDIAEKNRIRRMDSVDYPEFVEPRTNNAGSGSKWTSDQEMLSDLKDFLQKALNTKRSTSITVDEMVLAITRKIEGHTIESHEFDAIQTMINRVGVHKLQTLVLERV